MKRIVTILVWIFLIVFILFIGADLLLSDFGSGESKSDRLIAIGIYLFISGIVIYLFKKKVR